LWLAARNCTDPSMPVRAHRLVRPELIETAVLTTAQRCAQTASSDGRRGGCRRGGQPRADGRKSRHRRDAALASEYSGASGQPRTVDRLNRPPTAR
jgi:hypothetical protein